MVTVLLGCPELLTFLGVANVTDARNGNMYLDALPRSAEEYDEAAWAATFPSIIIGTPGDESEAFLLTATATGSSTSVFTATGIIEVIFSVLADTNDPITDQERNFKNSVGTILEEMTDQSMAMQQIPISQYGRSEPTDQSRLGVILSAWVRIPWGTFSGDEE